MFMFWPSGLPSLLYLRWLRAFFYAPHQQVFQGKAFHLYPQTLVGGTARHFAPGF
jgi:hypothetical protein